MVIFKKKNEEIYLITNLKVMFTSLKVQNNLVKVKPNKKILLLALMSWIYRTSKFYLIVRNPYDRTESLYKSKFLVAEKYCEKMIVKYGNVTWQKCTEYFFPFLNIAHDMDPTTISKKLASTKFQDFVAILPSVFMREAHMIPQYHSLKFTFKKIGILFSLPIKFQNIFKIESQENLNEMARIFDLDLSIKANRTSGNIKWNNSSRKIVENIYEKDFRYFKYEKSKSA